MKKFLLISVLFLGVAQSAPSEGYDVNTYYNARYAFKVSYPSVTDNNRTKGLAFTLGEEPANGDGIIMYNNLDGANITVFGQWSGILDSQGNEDTEDLNEAGMVIGCTLNSLLNKYKESNVTYKHRIGNTAIVSGISADNIFYDKAVYVKDNDTGRCIFLSIKYPISEKEKYDGMVKEVASSFSAL